MKTLLTSAFVAVSSLLFAESHDVNVTVRRAPYVVPSVSTRSEGAWARCRYCGSKTHYERKSKWDVDKHEWIVTTKAEDIPDVCRKCRRLERDQEKLDRNERDLDRKIEYQQTRGRVKDKKRQLEDLRKENR